MRWFSRWSLSAVCLFTCAAPLLAQRRSAPAAVSADTLRVRLYALAHDSMGGRDTGSPGNVKAADWVAALFQRYGLEPAGDNGTWFQTVPFYQYAVDRNSTIQAGTTTLVMGRDFLMQGSRRAGNWSLEGVQATFGGVVTDSTTWPAAANVAGKLVVLSVPPTMDFRALGRITGPLVSGPRFASMAGMAIVSLDQVPSDLRDQILQPQITVDTTAPTRVIRVMGVTRAAADAMLAAGQLHGTIAFSHGPLEFPARNVVGILRGSDPALRNTYLSLSAHNDHVGFTRAPIDHDSTRAFNRVVRPMGADSRLRPATPEEAARVQALRDSLGRAHPARPDSIFNGADDDGSGTVALTELARVLSAGPRPKRSILFVSHAAEERGLLGSQWFTDHATVPVDSIIAEIDEDMIGRGNADDLPEGGPTYLEVIGAKRLSQEFGDTLEAVNARQGTPFVFNYTFDAPGHPLQYYCRADHYSYARYGIPAVAFSRGEHMDYHQVTDEAQYIDYTALARVAQMVADQARAIANMNHRPFVNGPHGDPHAPCRQ